MRGSRIKAINGSEQKAEIVLNGQKEDATMLFSDAIEAGNKVLVNIANMTFFGKN